MTAVQAYDGKSGWSVAPFMGRTEPVAMSAEEAAQAVEQADIAGPLVDYKAKGHTVELVGPDKVDDRDAWKLKLTLKNGTVRQVYLDAASFLEVKTESKRTIRGVEVEVEGRLGRLSGGGRNPLPALDREPRQGTTPAADRDRREDRSEPRARRLAIPHADGNQAGAAQVAAAARR